MKKIAIIGGGVSGLSAARFLMADAYVHIFESASRPGGLICCNNVDGSLFHICGGHVWNTKIEEVNKWFWTVFNKSKDFVKARRNSAVCMGNGTFVAYPIENHIYQLDSELQSAIIEEWMSLKSGNATNFDEFLRNRFGQTLYELYFKPYNRKIWQRDLSDVPIEWLAGKLPMPTVKEMLLANINHSKEETFVHSSFYYPKSGGSQFIADTLAAGLDVQYNACVERIDIGSDGKLSVNGDRFDHVVFCGNVRDLPRICPNADLSTFELDLAGLEFHGTTTVFCEIDNNPYSWFYQPSIVHDSHRVICTGNFAKSNNAPGKMTCTVEFTGEVVVEKVNQQLQIMPFHPQYLAHNFSPCTYPLQKSNTRSLVSDLKKHLAKYHIYLVGRFAEWEYYNMDAAIASAMRASRSLLTNETI